MGYFDNYPPFSFGAPNGSMTGALIDDVELMGQLAGGFTFEHKGYPWARAQAMVERGLLDGFCTTASKRRQVYAEFCTTPIVSVRFGIYHRIDDPRALSIHSVADMRALRQGNFIGAGYPAEHLEPEHIHWVADEETILRMIAADHLDIYVEGKIATNRKLEQMGLANRLTFTPAPFLPSVNFCFGLRSSFTDSSAVVAKMEAAAQTAKKSGAFDAILAKYGIHE